MIGRICISRSILGGQVADLIIGVAFRICPADSGQPVQEVIAEALRLTTDQVLPLSQVASGIPGMPPILEYRRSSRLLGSLYFPELAVIAAGGIIAARRC